MADNSFEWAASKGLVRKNAVHKEDEARLVLDDSFKISTEEGNEMSSNGSFEVKDPDGTLLNTVEFDMGGDAIGDDLEHETPSSSNANAGSFKFLV